MEKRLAFRLLLHLALAGATVALATSATAQTLPMPTLPAPPPTETGSTTPDEPNQPADTGPATPDEPRPPNEDSLPEAARLQSAIRTLEPGEAPKLDYSFDLGMGWSSNAGLNLSDSTSDYMGIFRGMVRHTTRRPTSIFRISGEGVGFLYRDLTVYNRADGRGALGGSRQFSPRTSASFGVGVSYDHTDSSFLLAEQGMLLPLTRTVNYQAGIGIDHRLSTRTSLRLDGRYYRLDFPESDVLTDGSSIRATAALDRRLGRRDTLSAETSAELAQSFEPGETTSTWSYYMSTQWQRILSPRTAFLLEGGASYTSQYDASGLSQPWRFYGGVSFTRTLSRSQVVAYYRRQVVPVFGFGRLRLTDSVGISASVPIGRPWRLALGTSYTRNAAPDEGEVAQSRFDAFTSLGRQLSRHLRLSALGRYYRQEASGLVPELETFDVGLFLVVAPSR